MSDRCKACGVTWANHPTAQKLCARHAELAGENMKLRRVADGLLKACQAHQRASCGAHEQSEKAIEEAKGVL